MPAKNLITFRKGTSTQWASADPSVILASGEPGYDLSNNILKVGDGINSWSNLKSVVDINKDASISGLINSKSIILGNKSTAEWSNTTQYNKFDVVKFQNNLYAALINFNTQCPYVLAPPGYQFGPENWFCCPDNIHMVPTSADCPSSTVNPSNFSPTGYPSGWALIGSGDFLASDIYGANLYIDNIKSAYGSSLYSINEDQATINKTSIGGTDGCSINLTPIGQTSPSVAKFSAVSITQSLGVSGSLVVKNGNIRVYDDAGPYSTTISSTGLQINYTTSLTDVDLVDLTILPTPTSFLNNTILDGRGIFNFFPRRPIIGDKVLFRNFSDPKNNGVYQLQQYYDHRNEIVPEWAIPIRIAPYANNTAVANLSRVKNKYDNIVYILNFGTNGGNSTVGVDNLIFSPDPGEQVMTIQSTKDVDFIAAISAKQKYFRIQHPDPDSSYQYLQYGSLESPYNGVRLTGCGKLKKGECKIVLPVYMKYLIHENDINIQLTNKSHHKILYIDKIDLDNNSFIVKGYRSKTGGPYEFYWSFTGIRKDVPLLVSEQ